MNPSPVHTIARNLPAYVDDSRGNIPPLGLLYLASAVEAVGWNVEVCDASAGDTLENYGKPDLIGITATTFTLVNALAVAKQVKEMWGVPVMIGGIHATIFPEETARLPNIDCAFTGEAEETLPRFLDAIVKGSAKVVRGHPVDVTRLGMPSRSLINTEKYYSVIGSSRYLTSMLTSRGCPYQCIFCHRETMGKQFRAASVGQVLEEIATIKTLGIGEILIYDDTFTVDKMRVEGICRGIAERRIDIMFDIRARVDHINVGILRLLKGVGCRRIHLGVEASSDRILEKLRKGITVAQVEEAFRCAKDVGIETLAYFIIGSPGETVNDILRTIEFAKKLNPDYCHFAIMTPYPATPLYHDGLAQGLYGDYWQEFAQNPREDFEVPYWPEIPRAELVGLLDEAYRAFYWRPSRIVSELAKTKSLRQLTTKALGAMQMLRRGV